MKVFTITCHDVYNYGASLQAYALQTYLTILGHDCNIIDYKPEYLRRSYNFWYIEKNSRFYNLCCKSRIFHFLYALRLAPITFKTWKRKRPFDQFKKTFLHCTKLYSSIHELQLMPPQGEVYIAGSDQIWNCNLPNGKDNSFYLDFGPKHTRRISYAASIGVESFPQEEIPRIRQLLKSFNNISVREATAAKVIKNLGFSCSVVCDPVFLLDSNQWLSIVPRKTDVRRYVLVYDIFADDVSIRNAAIKKSTELGALIYSINDSHKCNYADRNISDAGPIEFLWYVNNAEFVISNSFHATAFSVLFNKQFATFYKKANSSRMVDFLNSIELVSHFNPVGLLPIVNDWARVNQRLHSIISSSKVYLDDSLK